MLAAPAFGVAIPVPGVPAGVPLPLPATGVVGSLLSGVGGMLTGGVRSIATWAFDGMTGALLATTQVNLGGWFDAPWRAMLAVAATLAVPILLVGVASEVLAGRPAAAVRRGVLLPLAIGPGLLAARGVLGLLLAVVNGCCALLVRLSLGGPAGFAHALTAMRPVLGVSAGGAPGAGAVPLLLVVLVTAFLAFVIWVELAVRAALVYLLAAFIPLALAGLMWSATARWTRRLVEVLVAVVLSQLVITMVMVMAAAALGGHADGLAAGVDRVTVGLALLFLGTLGLPMTLRLLPQVVEASVAAGSGATAATAVRRHSGQLLMGMPHPAARFAGAAVAGRSDLLGVGPRAAAPTAPPSPPPSPSGVAAAAAGTTGSGGERS